MGLVDCGWLVVEASLYFYFFFHSFEHGLVWLLIEGGGDIIYVYRRVSYFLTFVV